jgi:anaerobic magnesium-protoporphyrin IX monomethyl ester cyclase
VEPIVAEVRTLAEDWGVDTLEVADEYPTCGRERWEGILDRLIAEDLGVELLVETRAADIVRDEDILHKYREAGVLHAYVGVETPRQERLDGMRKDLAARTSKRSIELLNEAGIISETSFLLGFPDETPETVAYTLDAALDYDPDLAFFIAITPWPYSDMYADVADRVEEHDYSRYNLTNPIIRSDAMSRAELADAMARSFATFYREKMSRLGSLAPHKRKYLTAVAKLLAEESYLSAHTGMPERATPPAGSASTKEEPCASPF